MSRARREADGLLARSPDVAMTRLGGSPEAGSNSMLASRLTVTPFGINLPGSPPEALAEALPGRRDRPPSLPDEGITPRGATTMSPRSSRSDRSSRPTAWPNLLVGGFRVMLMLL